MDAVDIDTIDDEDVLKQMWQVTEDFAEKRRIRARMYKLREKRLKDFYTSDDVMTAGSPSAASLPSQSATSSYNYSTSSATTETITTSSSLSAMETDEADGVNGQSRQVDQKRRNDANQEEDAVSEKIRRKSSVRTKRYQMILAASGGTQESSQTSTTSSSSSSRMETSERAMSPDSLSGSQLIMADGPGQKSLNIRPEESNVSVSSDSSYQELKSSSRRREFQEGDILTIQQVTETWRRIRESGQSAAVTQRVTLTKTTRQRVSDGAVLEENEDEVIDDIDNENRGDFSGSDGITAVDAALRRSSIIAITSTDGAEENVSVSKKKFETGDVVIDDALSEPDSLDNLENNLPEPDGVDNHSQADSLEMTQTTFTSMTTQHHQSNSLFADSDVSNHSAAEAAGTAAIAAANIEEQVEQLIVPATESKQPVARSSSSSATRSKRTPSESPSRGATSASPANKKRADSAELRKSTAASSSSGSGSRTGLGGINRSASGSSTSAGNTTKSSSKTTATVTASLKGSSSSIPRLTSTPISAQKGKKTGATASEAAVQDDSVTEFLQLEKEIQGEKVVNEEAKTTAVKRPVNTSAIHRPTTPVTSRKAAAEPASTRSTATSSPRVQPSSSFSSADKKVATKKAETTTTSVSRSSSSAASASVRKELASPSSSKPTTVLGRPAMIRTVETTRTITVRDRDEDKPWRMNSSSSSSTRSNKGVSGLGRPARKDLHNNVMSVVEKYVDSEGCALHGSHPHIHDDVEDVEDVGDVGHGHSPSPPPSTATAAASATPTQTATATPVVEKPVQKAKTSDEGEENEPVAPQTNGVAEEDGPAPAVEEEPCTEQVVAESARREENTERPKKLSVITTGSMAPTDGGAESATSPLNKSGSRLSVASPVLGSPSVVKKARSLFRSDSMEGPAVESAKAEAAPPPAVPTGGTANISKIRSSFENATTTATSTIKRENTKLWEPAANNPRIHKLEPRPPSVVAAAALRDGQPVPSRSSSAGLFTKSRSPSPIKDVVAVATVAPPGRQTTPTPTPQESAAPVVDDVTAVGGSSSTGEGQVIEDIEDLTLLENMLNTATNYDDRSRIRAHMRIVKKKLGLAVSSPMPTRKAAAPAPKTSFSEPAANRNKLADVKRKPSESAAEAKNEPVHQVRTPAAVEPVPVEPVSSEPVSAEPVPAERAAAAAELAVTVQRDEVAVVEEMQMSSVSTTSMMMTTMTSETSESSSRKSSMTQQQTKVRKISQPYDCRSETKEFVPRVAEEQQTVTVAGQVNGDGGATPVSSSDQEGSSETSSPRMSRAPWRRQSSEANMVKTPTHLPEPESNPETLDITSSYGTGPMDENGRPLFGLGALRRRPTKPLNITGADEGQQSPQPIIIERSQTLTELQKLHESQTVQSKGELEPVEKPRAKLRDTFTNWTDTEADGDRAEPIISERSQALREIIRIHEQQVSSAEATTVEAPPPSPTRPKAKLKDSFVAPSPDCADEPDPSSSAIEQMIERSESFQTIVKRHQELSTSQTPTGPQASPPMKRPGILKKPKDWSSPSPQEVPSPVKDDQAMTSTSTSCSLLTSSSRKTSVEVSSAATLDSGGARKASVESSIEIQLNPVQSSSIVVTEIPAPALMERRSSGAAPTYSTVQYNSVQDVKMDNRRGSTHQQYQQQQPRKFSIEVEPSPTMHTSSVTLSTASKAPAPAPMSSRAVPAVASAPFVLSGETAGHSVRSTSTFQLSTSGRNSSVVTAPIIAASVAAVAAPVPTGDDPTPWRRKSIPREPSIPRDAAAVTSTATFIPAPGPAPVPVQVAEIPLAQPHQSVPTRVSTAKMSMQETLPPAAVPAPVSTFVSSSPLTVRSNRISSSSVSGTETSNFQRHGSINQRYRPSQPENNAPYGSGGVKPSPEPRVKTLAATGASVRALAQKFLVTGEEKSQAQVSKSSAYPKAGLIYRSNSFRSQNNADGAGGSIGLVRSESLRISPARSRVSMDRQSQERNVDEPFSALSMTRRESNTLMSSSERRTSSSYNQSTSSSLVVNGGHDEPLMVATPADSLASSATFTTTATTSKSFLQDRTPVRGMQDIIGRMRATDAGSAVGSSEDERSLSLLNKLIGAQILVQCTEQAATSAGVAGGQPSRPEASLQSFSSCTEQRSADGTRLSRTSTQQRTGSSFESGQDEDSGASWTRRSSSTAKFQTTSTVHQPQQFNITATISDDHIGNGAGGIGIGTGMAQTSIPGVAAAAAAGSRAGCVIDGIDINTCTDDFKLNELLDNCNDYETRRQIRARIKTLLSDVKVHDGDSSSSSHSSSHSSSSSSSSHCTANSSNVSSAALSAAPSAAHSDVMDWVRRQAQTHGSTTANENHQAQAALVVDAPPMNELPVHHPAAIQSQESGELFDSGTESGEDSTTQSNHSQSDLNSFMANLAKLSLEQQQLPQTCVAPSSASASASTPSNGPAAGDFLRQVDSVLDRLKTSLQPDDLAELNVGPSTDHQEVLHQHMASGGLDKQWRIHPQQQTELIGLIDRLKTSLHHLQSSDPAPAPSSSASACPSPSGTLAPPVASTGCTVAATSLQTSAATTTTTMIVKRADGNGKINHDSNHDSNDVEKRTNQMSGTTKTMVTTVASPAGSAASLSGITCVKLRAKTFAAPPAERPLSRPNSFLLSVSSKEATTTTASCEHRHHQPNRLSWRSSSEPNTPVTSPSPTPTPSPLPPPKVHWRSPMDFLAHSTTTTTPASSLRPVWCRYPSSSASGNSATSPATTPAQAKIKVLEKSGIRGRFVQPELNPAPVVTPKAPAPAVRLPSFSLNKVQTTGSPPSASRQHSRPQTPQTPPVTTPVTTPVTLEQRPMASQQDPLRPVQQKAQRVAQHHERHAEKKQEPERRSERPVRQEEQPQEEQPQEEQPQEAQTEAEDTSRSVGRNKSSSHGPSSVPWKVKLAKKKAERSQTSAAMDGQVSVDLRKSIRLAAATRKSMEDVRQSVAPSQPSFKLTSPSAGAYPLLKQKSMGELYAPRLPKPFQRSESVGAAASMTVTPLNTPLGTPEAKSSLLKKFNWNSSRSSSVDRAASDLSSAPQTPLSPDPPSPVVMAAGLKPSKSGHSWVLSMKTAHAPVAFKAAAPADTEVEEPNAEVEEAETKEMIKEAHDKVANQKEMVENHGDEESEQEGDEVVTVGVLNLGSKDEAAKVAEPVQLVDVQRQSSTDLKADPSAGLFTPAETLQIAIHKAAIKASLSRQMSERNVGEPSSPLLMPESPVDKTAKVNAAEAKSKTTAVVEATKGHSHSHPLLIRATTSPKLTAPSSLSSLKPVAVVPPAQSAQSTQSQVRREANALPAPTDSNDNNKSPAVKSAPQADESRTAEADVTNAAMDSELQKAQEQYIKTAMAPIPTWKERARRSNTVAFSPGCGSSWRPVQAPSRLTIKTENDRKFQSLFQKNAEPSTGGFQARPLPSDPSAGGMWTNKFANIRSSFESRPNSTSTTPTQSRSRRSSADDNQCVAVTSAHIQFQVKPQLQKAAAPPSPTIPPAKANHVPDATPEPEPKPPTLKLETEAMKSPVRVRKPEEPKRAIATVAVVPKVEPLHLSSRTNGSIRSSSVGGTSVGGTSTRQPSPLVTPKRPEEKKDAALQRLRMTVEPCVAPTAASAHHGQPGKMSSARTAIADGGGGASSATAATLVKSSSGRRLRNERSCSSVRTQSSLRSDSKEEDDDVEADQEGDDEASSSSSSSDEADEVDEVEDGVDGVVVPSVKVQPPTPASTSNISGLKNLTKILQKFSVADDAPRHVPNWPHTRLAASCGGILKKSFSSHQIRSTTTPPALVGGLLLNNNSNNSNDFGLSRTKSSSAFGPSAVPPPNSLPLKLTLTGLKPDHLTIPNATASHYVDAPGPTLVGLVARNVMSSAHSTAGSSSNNSIASSALNYAAANLKATASPSDHSPTSLLMKSVSSSRIVTGAKQQLERPKSLIINTNVSSLAAPDISPGMLRRNPSLGTKQFEASLSPDSAEKKQREILQFFGSASASASAAPVSAPIAAPIAAKDRGTSSTSASPKPSSCVTKTAASRSRSVLTSRQFSLDNNSGGSDVDELFNQFLADQILSPEAAGHRSVHSNENPLSHQPVADQQRRQHQQQTSRNAVDHRHSSAPAKNETGPSKFADRRRAWEASTCASITLHSSLMMRPSESSSNTSSRPADVIQRSSNNNAFGSSTVQSKTEVTMTRQSNFTRSGQPGQSAFSKFQQLDQSVKSSTSGNSIATPTGGFGGVALLGGQQFDTKPTSRPTTPNFLTVPASPRPRLNTAEIKERMLNFCKRATADYQVSSSYQLSLHPFTHTQTHTDTFFI